MTETAPAKTLTARGDALLALGRWEEAAEVFRQAIATDPSVVRPYCQLGNALLLQGKPREAIPVAQRAIALDPNEEWPYRVLSKAFINTSANGRAFRAAREAVRLAPLRANTHACLAEAFIACRDERQARTAIDEALRLEPRGAAWYGVLGRVEMLGHRWKEAESALRRELELDPQSWVAMTNLGVVLGHQRRRTEAVEIFMTAARQDPRRALGRRNVVSSTLTFLQAGRPTRALLAAVAVALLLLGVPGGLIGAVVLLAGPEVVFAYRLRRIAPVARAALREILSGLSTFRRVLRVISIGIVTVLPVAIYVTGLFIPSGSASQGETPEEGFVLLGIGFYVVASQNHVVGLKRIIGAGRRP